MGKKDPNYGKKLKGFRDITPKQMQLKWAIIESVWQRARLANFGAIETPALEYQSTLIGSGGGDTDKEIYRFQDHGARDVALRFDLTVPFARFVAENLNEISLPFKKFQVGNVWRGEKPQKGRYREFTQADLDIIGADGLAADVELVSCLLHCIGDQLQVPFTMKLGNRVILSALIQKFAGQGGEAHQQDILIALDKLAKIGPEKVAGIIHTKTGVATETADRLIETVSSGITAGGEVAPGVREALAENSAALEELERFNQTLGLLQAHDCGHARVIGDLTIARGLGYYTGLVFETFVDALPEFGSISSGGRYDELISRFSSVSLKGVGGSIGVDRLLAAMEALAAQEMGTLSAQREGLFFAVASADALPWAFATVQRFRQHHMKADLDITGKKLGQQLKYADKHGFAGVVVLGTEEVAAGTVQVKTLADGQQSPTISMDAFAHPQTFAKNHPLWLQ